MRTIPLLFAVLLWAGCGSSQKQESNNPTKPENNAGAIHLSDAQLASFKRNEVQLARKNVRRTVRLNGNADVPPQNRVSVSHALGGYVRSIHLLPGKPFRKGQVLAVLEDNQYIQLQQDYLIAAAELERAGLNYERQRMLNENKASSDKNFQAATAEYETLRITLSALQEKLRLIGIDPNKLTAANITRQVRIYAPFDGVVGNVLVNQGKYVSPSDVLFELINPSEVLLDLKVFEKDWPHIAIGQELTAYTNERPDQVLTGEVVARGSHINSDGTATIHARLRNPDQANIAPGMYVNAVLETINNEVYTLPEEALVSFEGTSYAVEVLDSNTFNLLVVQTGIADEGFVEIVDGERLRGKTFLGEGAYTVLMGVKNQAEE